LNVLLISAGTEGITVTAAAEKSGEEKGLVSSQYSWLVGKGLVTRKEEKLEDGKRKTFRYFVKPTKPTERS
jgi:predicted transcriptional regulator